MPNGYSIPIVKFPKEGVVVMVPVQAQPVTINQLQLPKLAAMPGVPGGFQPFRPVINLKVVLANQPDTTVTHFNPPITICVRYTPSDVDMAKTKSKDLSLGYWDGSTWIQCSAKTHYFYFLPDLDNADAGWGIIKIDQWNDPIPTWGT
jgi:hypothetical protein